MTWPFDKHIDDAELDSIVQHPGDEVLDRDRQAHLNLREAWEHVETCPGCRLKVEMHKSAQSDFSRVGVSVNVSSGPNCLGEREWCDLAAGLLPETRSRGLLQHAAQCEHCGPLLRKAADIFSTDVTAQEEQIIASLQSGQLESRRVMAKRLQRETKKQQRPFDSTMRNWRGWFFWPRPVFAVASLAVLIAALWLAQRTSRSPSAEQLLAEAYTQHRTIEIRFAGATYAPMRLERKPNGSNLDKSPSLLKAEEIISENLSKNPNDPEWLRAKGRADLLDGNYDAAIKSLERALAIQPESTSLLTDVASAYFVRGESADRPTDYRTASKMLEQALTSSPRDPVALFNRALLAEKLDLYAQAVNDWEDYLRVDSRGGWADEARSHLSALKQKIDQHVQSLAAPLMDPAALERALAVAGDTLSSVDQRSEEYLALAIRQWLPIAYPVDGGAALATEQQVQYRLALGRLSDLLAELHGDPWLRDLIEESSSSLSSLGIQALSHAFQANEEGDPDAALVEARRAVQLFRKNGGKAGELRAAVEEIYALHRKYLLRACLSRIIGLENNGLDHEYPWIAIQLQLEHYACASGAPESEADRLARAREASRRARYDSLYLRAVAFTASLETDLGDNDKAWRWDLAGLEKYWSGPYPPLRAQHFYDDMSIAAEDSLSWGLAIAVEKEAVAAISASRNRSGEGIARIKLARSEMELHQWEDAQQQYSLALSAFSSLTDNKSNRAFRSTAELGIAEVAASQQRWQVAEDHLRYARENLPSDFESGETWVSLYGTLAELRHQSGDESGRRRACVAAVRIAETALVSVHTELDRLRWNRNSSKCYRELVQSQLLEHDTVGALEWWERYRGAGLELSQSQPLSTNQFGELDHSLSLSTPTEIETQLSSIDRETVIAYAELGERVSAWVYDDRGIYWQPLEVSSAVLEREAAHFAILCADPETDATTLRVKGQQLYKLLLTPLIANLDPARTLVIEADRSLSSIPFAALVDPEGSYLSDRFQIVYLPGAAYLRVRRESVPITGQETALVVGPPAISADDQSRYAALPDASGEAEYVAAQFRRSVLISGRRATLRAISDRLPQAAIFHFAGHTRSEPGHSGLLLAPETDANGEEARTVFSADDIESHKLPLLRLAVLSACSTAGDEDESADNLASAFLRAGVPNVVATRWALDSAVSAAFMRVFYENARKMEIAAALSASMKEVRSIPQFSHPYYWAVFDLFGRAANREPA